MLGYASTMPFDDHDEDEDVISEGPTSTVTRIADGPRFVAVKTSTTVHAKEPHDIVKEVRLLASFSHANIIPLIKQQSKSHRLSFWMPYIPYSLDELLECSRFSPHPIVSFGNATSTTPTLREVQFAVLAKSIIFQVICGVNYLHGEHVHVAHRDIKPANVLLTTSGRVQLIDFGIAFRTDEKDEAKARDLWSESAARMYFEVSTGPYRAPELLFGPRSYDAFAIDAWSLGATFAEFFSPLRLLINDEDDDESHVSFPRNQPDAESGSESGSESNADQRAPLDRLPPQTPFIIPRTGSWIPTGRWTRTTLFDGTRGEIGLAWSIFRVFGTPSEETWPSFQTLPDAGKVSFVHVDASDLASLLPNLPPTHASAPSPFDLVRRFLTYEPTRRLRPAAALAHPWFSAEPGAVLPADDGGGGYPPWGTETDGMTRLWTLEGNARTLGELLHAYVGSGSYSG